jgi:osmotically-inducible protein OsmY
VRQTASKRHDRPQSNDTRTRASNSTQAKAVIEEKLKSEPGLDSKDIQVTLTSNAVTLSGSVANTDDRDKAVSVARSYAGDREVEDHLSVQRPD